VLAVQFLERSKGTAVLLQLLVAAAVVVLGVLPEGQDDLVDGRAGLFGFRIASAVSTEEAEDAGVFSLALGGVPRAEENVAAAAGCGPHSDDGLPAGMLAVGRGRSLLRSGHGINPYCGRMRKIPHSFGV
jgi:hypothetical protein